MIALLLFLLADARIYHGVSIAGLKNTTWTHVSVCGQVTLVKHEEDGDWHLRLNQGSAFIVAEIVPAIPLPVPRVAQFVRVAGISREDKAHRWWEVNPVEALSVVSTCAMSPAG